jgi:hypothetical protein
MAPKKQPKSELWKTAIYYRNNPKARVKKKVTDTIINARSEQRKKRSELSTLRKKYKNSWKKINWKDLSHTKNGIILKSIKSNRGSKNDSEWDRNSRW